LSKENHLTFSWINEANIKYKFIVSTLIMIDVFKIKEVNYSKNNRE
jgi:hypothetical protein